MNQSYTRKEGEGLHIEDRLTGQEVDVRVQAIHRTSNSLRVDLSLLDFAMTPSDLTALPNRSYDLIGDLHLAVKHKGCDGERVKLVLQKYDVERYSVSRLS